MQNNNDQVAKTKEVPSVQRGLKQENADVHKDQQSLFDAEEAFSESMIVEKDSVEIGSNPFEDKSDDSHENVSAKDLQDSARGYYDAMHSQNIEDKVNELRKLASDGFSEDFDDEIQQGVAAREVFAEDDEKRLKKNRKKRRKGLIPDDDMEKLSSTVTATEVRKEPVVVESNSMPEKINEVFEETDTGSGTEYKNPLGTYSDEDEEETEEDRLFKLLAGSKNIDELLEEDENEPEYTERAQEEGILKELRSRAIFSALSVILTLAVTLLCFYFEMASGTKLPHPSFFEAGKFGVTYLMCMLQFMCLGVIFNFDGMKRAFRAFKPSKSSVEVYCASTVIVCALHSILSAVFASDSPSLRSFCSVGCIALFALSLNSFMKEYSSLSSFCIAASKSPKLSCVKLDRDSGEARVFEKYLDSDTTVLTVGKSEFVDGFFKKIRTLPKAGSKSAKMVYISVIFAIASGVACGVLNGLYSGITAFTAVCLAAFPINALLSTILPFFIASSKAKKNQTAFIGEAACDFYETAGVISFDDTEVFPAKSVKVSSIRTYSENRIDKVILYMARVFDKAKGPLSFVFANSVQNVEDSGEAQILEQVSDGISARIDGRDVLVGNENFMKLYDIETPIDNIDESFTRSLGSIMYMSVDGALAAKFYIKYTMSRSFEPILRSFYDAGICVGVRTFDPCVTTELICGNLKGSNYPVSVIKKCSDAVVSSEKTDSAVITLSGINNFLKGFIRLDNLRNIYRSNKIISTFCMIVGMLLTAAICLTGIVEMNVIMVCAFQLLWCIPTILISLFSK